jgi:hypothetical protein
MKKSPFLIVFTLLCIGMTACSKISVTEATYGLNRGYHDRGNATQYLKAECDGKRRCDFAVRKAASRIGDPDPRAARSLDVRYRCGKAAKTGHVDGDAAVMSIALTCQ